MKLSDIASLKHLELEGDFSGKSEAYYVRTALPRLGSTDIFRIQEHLISTGMPTVRVCLHGGPSDSLHEMVIFHKKGGAFPIHKHTGKAESYQIIDGRLLIETFDDQGKCTDEFTLSSEPGKTCLICKIPPNLWHRTLPLSDYVVFKETRPGPFEKGDSVLAPPGFGTG